MAETRPAPRHMRRVEAPVADGSQLRGESGQGNTVNTVASVAFVAALFALLLAPLVLMPFSSADEDAEKRALAPAPQLVVDGAPNVSFLADAGAFFSDNFAFRSQLVDLDATIKQCLFRTSSVGNVVVGTDGWLYYAGELDDYRHERTMSETALRNAAHNLALMQEYVQGMGKRFVLVIAPNKSTIYPEHMPYYELEGTGATNLQALMPLLRERGVNVVDAGEVLTAAGGELYFARDSHWTDEGARLVYAALDEALEGNRDHFDDQDVVRSGHMGDLDGMLHPTSARPEEQLRHKHVDGYAFVNDATSVEDAYIVTASDATDAQGLLLMYRDSFGNNLLPPFATSYQQAVFTKLVPFDMGSQMVGFASDVIVERAERHLSFFASTPPYLPAPQRSLEGEEREVPSDTTVYVEKNGPYLMVDGTLDQAADVPDAHVYVQLALGEAADDLRVYECFRVSNGQAGAADFEGQGQDGASSHVQGDDGYCAYVDMSGFDEASVRYVRIMVGSQTDRYVVATHAL